MALPAALSFAAGPVFGALGAGGKLPLFANMSPLMANALKQTALGYGTAALSGSRRPAQAALAAGLTSIPFSYFKYVSVESCIPFCRKVLPVECILFGNKFIRC